MKILVISHNVFSNTSSMGRTLANFFVDFPQENLAQLYLHTEVPTTDICTNYYRITDFDLVKKRKKDIGTVFGVNDIKKDLKSERVDEGKEAQIYSLGRKRKPYMYVGRNLLWGTKKWKNEKLLNWVREFNPDVIFFASGDYVFLYKIAMDIAEICNIPIVTYICDDYYFLRRKSVSPLYHVNRNWYKNTLKKLFSKHKNIVAICDKITTDYSKEFGILSTTIMTSSQVTPFEKKESTDKIIISYIGNLGYQRNVSLIELGQKLKKVTDSETLIDVYSTETRPQIIDTLTKENGINFRGGISYDEVQKVMKKSDILIHTESMNEERRKKIRYSVSTKIADSLSCGRCLLAYGPSDVASMEYLKNNDCACVVTDVDDLEKSLKEIIENADKRQYYVNRALEIAKEKHNIDKNAETIQKILIETINKKGER